MDARPDMQPIRILQGQRVQAANQLYEYCQLLEKGYFVLDVQKNSLNDDDVRQQRHLFDRSCSSDTAILLYIKDSDSAEGANGCAVFGSKRTIGC